MIRHMLLPICLLACSLPAGAAEDAPPRCTYVAIGTLPVRLVGSGLEPVIEGTIDGMPATMLVDTGDYSTHITMTGAVKRGMALRMTEGHVGGIGGTSRLLPTRVKELSIAPVHHSRDITLDIIHSTAFAPVYDAILGAPFLLQADLEVDLRAKLLKFFKPKNCGDTPLYLWKEDTVVVPFDASRDTSFNPHFTVLINDKEVDAVIDTGASFSMLTRHAARRIGIDLDGPDVKRAGSVSGIGSASIPYWTARVKSFAIGGETILGTELGMGDSESPGDFELLLGRDFLRTHHVLFAMSQRKLYIAYLGGRPFSSRHVLEPWVREEAEGGNPGAQYALAALYRKGEDVARDPVQARAWLEKAAASGEPQAILDIGADLVKAGKHAEAIATLRKGLERLPTESYGALWLYLARVHNGEAALARTELRTSMQKLNWEGWPAPIARFYLGDIDAARLLENAGENKDFAEKRTCEANSFLGQWYAAQGARKPAEPLLSRDGAHCDAS